MNSDEGPSTRIQRVSAQRQRYIQMAEPLPEEVVLDMGDSAPPRRSLQHRPLDLADNYEIADGIPVIVFGQLEDFNPHYRRFAFSSDGTRIALQSGWQNICLYDVADNFSLSAEGINLGSSAIVELSFKPNCNDELIAVFKDSTVSTISTLYELQASSGNPDIVSKAAGSLVVTEIGPLIKNFSCENDLRFGIATELFETWIWGWDTSINNVLYIGCLVNNELRKQKIETSYYIVPTQAHASITQRVFMSNSLYGDSQRHARTRIWSKLTFSQPILREDPFEIRGRGLGWSQDGAYLLNWSLKNNGHSELELYSIEYLRRERNTARLALSHPLGSEVQWLKTMVLDRTTCSLIEGDDENDENMPFVAILVSRISGMRLLFWDSLQDKIIKNLDAQVIEIKLPKEYHIDYCISPKSKWAGIVDWKNGVIGLLSLKTDSLVWTTNLVTKSLHIARPSPISFDPLGSKLVVNANENFYIFAPPCLIEDYDLEFESTTYNLTMDSGLSLASLRANHLRLIPKSILFQAFTLQLSGATNDANAQILDIASSAVMIRVVVLIRLFNTLSLFIGSLKNLCTNRFDDFVQNGMVGVDIPQGVDKIELDESFSRFNSLGEPLMRYLFLYSDKAKNDDDIALFGLESGIQACFMNMKCINDQEIVSLVGGHWFSIIQTSDGSRVVCLGDYGVVIISLKEQTVLDTILYNTSVTCWLHDYKSKRPKDCLSISHDGRSVLLGWDLKHKESIIITSMDNHNCRLLKNFPKYATRCWSLGDNNEKVGYVTFETQSKDVSKVCIHNRKNIVCRKIGKEIWNKHVTRNMNEISKNGVLDYSLKFDEVDGCLWLIVIYRKNLKDSKLVWIPFSPYTSKTCIPSLHMLDYPAQRLENDELMRLPNGFKLSLFNMPLNKKTNLQIALSDMNKDALRVLLETAKESEIPLFHLRSQLLNDKYGGNCLDIAIKERDEGMIKHFLDPIVKQEGYFNDHASLMKRCFRDLWIYVKPLAEPLILRDKLGWDICGMEILSEIFTCNRYHRLQVGTCDSKDEWNVGRKSISPVEHWEVLNKSCLEKIKCCGGCVSTIKCTLKLFCMDNVCGIGLDGILRFLLMQKAPSYMFKTTLVKGIITWKWENIWKERCLQQFIIHVCFLVGFTTYTISIAYLGFDLRRPSWTLICLLSLLIVLMAASFRILFNEHKQLRAYQKDGETIFSNDKHWGLRCYLSSMWNVVEMITYTIMLIVIPMFHCLSIVNSSFIPSFYSCLAIEIILLWMKIWYFAQAYKETGHLVLLIENVIRDCIPFLFLVFIVLVCFGVALFILFQYIIREFESRNVYEEYNDAEEIKAIKTSFETPMKAMLTMFFAMIGTFDVEVYCLDAALSWFITPLFILYLAIQLVLMLNMLIALMGDTFNKVKSSAEEQLLLGRARFIDSCEASLSARQIKALRQKTKKYLYVLIPNTDAMETENVIWQGKVKTIEERVGLMLSQTQHTLKTSLACQEQKLDRLESKIYGSLERFKEKINTQEKTIEKLSKDIDYNSRVIQQVLGQTSVDDM